MKLYFVLFILFFCPQPTLAQKNGTQTSEFHPFKIEELVQVRDVVWGFDFLNARKIIFTQKKGALSVFDLESKKIEVISGAPKVSTRGQGGLLDVRVQNRKDGKVQIYLSYSEPVDSKATTALLLADLKGTNLENTKKLFSAKPASEEEIHFGSRIVFDDTGHVFLSVGERNNRDLAQSLESHLGKILRLRADGGIPVDNPFAKTPKALPEIWSFGHRNPQGLVWDQENKRLWEVEFGPLGGDELNLIEKGQNYGWPIVTKGREYSGRPIGDGRSRKEMKDPVHFWVPSISPSGMALYEGSMFPKWKGNLFLANLSGTHLRRLELKDSQVAHEEVLLQNFARLRHVRVGPEGALYFSTDDGRIGRLVAAPPPSP